MQNGPLATHLLNRPRYSTAANLAARLSVCQSAGLPVPGREKEVGGREPGACVSNL